MTIAISNVATTSGSIALAGDGLTIAVAPSARAAAIVPSCADARNLAGAEPDGGPARVRCADQAVRPGQREDLILALRVDRDQRHAAVHPGDHGERRDVDSLVLQRAADEVAELVVAAGAEEAHPRPEPRGRNGNVRALAAGREQEAIAEHGLARTRQPGRVAEHVGADGAADCDEAAHGLGIPIWCGIAQAYRPPCTAGGIVRAWQPRRATRSSAAGRRFPAPLQFLLAFLVWFVIFWVGHVTLLNQPMLRGFLYGIFWGGTFSLLTLLATRSEQTRRQLREHPEDSDAH